MHMKKMSLVCFPLIHIYSVIRYGNVVFDIHIFYLLSLYQEHEQVINQGLAVVLICLK